MKRTNLKIALIELLNLCEKQLDQTVTDKGLKNCEALANVRTVLRSDYVLSIDNSQRVYHITTSVGKQAFCNIEDLNNVIESLNTHQGYFKIFHFWNNKSQKVSKKDLLSFFEGAGIKQEFYY